VWLVATLWVVYISVLKSIRYPWSTVELRQHRLDLGQIMLLLAGPVMVAVSVLLLDQSSVVAWGASVLITYLIVLDTMRYSRMSHKEELQAAGRQYIADQEVTG